MERTVPDDSQGALTPSVIFSINTGRSGSHYLSCLFQHVERCRAFHEATPIGNGRPMREFLRGRQASMRALTVAKLERIRRETAPDEVYVESNHTFIKGFGWLLPDYIPQTQMGVIVLHRNREEIAQSYYRIGCSPLRRRGRRWLMLPSVRCPLLSPPTHIISASATYGVMCFVHRMHRRADRVCRSLGRGQVPPPAFLARYEMDALRWYVDETEARARRYREQFPDVSYFDVDVSELNTYEGVQRMLSHFNLIARPSIVSLLGNPTNLKQRSARPKTA
jgi:hypothetical protein